MKSIFLFLSIICLFACKQINDQHEGKNTIDKEILEQIKSHYQTIYGKGTRIEETNSDSILNIIYYKIPTDSDDYDGFLIDISIPKKSNMDLFSANSILYGDLNNDKIEEIVISVHTEGGGSGGNNWAQDIFVFEKIKGNYQMNSITPDGDICGCEGGSFRAKEITNGFLIGKSSCYKDDDPRCCPSIKYKTQVELANNKLKISSKTETN